MEEFGLQNAILEIDHGDVVYDFDKFPMPAYLALIQKQIERCYTKLHQDAKILVNFRDLTDVMPTHPERILQTVKFLVTLPEKMRIDGIIFEDATGKSVPEAVGSCTRFIKKVMDDYQYDGHLLVHVHEQFGYKDASTLEVTIPPFFPSSIFPSSFHSIFPSSITHSLYKTNIVLILLKYTLNRPYFTHH